MTTTSLRLPAEVIDQLKRQARARNIRYTSYVRSILEHVAHGETQPEISDIRERLERIERAVTGRHPQVDHKTA
ncbi:MAG: CopG family antitoxin [Streptosporangiaceae bacterium]